MVENFSCGTDEVLIFLGADALCGIENPASDP